MTRRLAAFLLAISLIAGCATPDRSADGDLTPFLRSHGDRFQRVLASPEVFRVQVLISEVVTNRAGIQSLRRHSYRVGAEYFYPASSIKLCGAVAALQVLEELAATNSLPDLLETPLSIEPLFPGDPVQRDDPANGGSGRITVGHELRKLALVSDNTAFNRLFDLVGHAGLNERMQALGLRSVVINHRLSDSRPIPDQRATAAVSFEPAGHPTLQLPPRNSALVLSNSGPGLLLGQGVMQGNRIFPQPMDFSRRNGISLRDLQDLLVKLVRPGIEVGTPPLNLLPQHRDFLVGALTEYPRESANPLYPEKDYPDDYCKFLLPGVRRVFPSTKPGERIAITGKIGQAYGFTVENSCLVNPRNGATVFVTAVIYTNSDGILNDDRYEYQAIAVPFLADLGEVVARRWLMVR